MIGVILVKWMLKGKNVYNWKWIVRVSYIYWGLSFDIMELFWEYEYEVWLFLVGGKCRFFGDIYDGWFIILIFEYRRNF